MAMSTATQPTTLGVLEDTFAQQLLSADSPYIESQNVVLQIRVPIPNCNTSCPTSSTYAYTHVDISVPTKLFLASQGEGLRAARQGGGEGEGGDFTEHKGGLALAGIVRRAIESTLGVKLHIRGGGCYYCGDDNNKEGPGLEISSVRMVQKGNVDLGMEGYHAAVVSPPQTPEKGECQQQQASTIAYKPVSPKFSWASPCWYFLPADYTIYLKSDDEGDEGGGGIVSTFHVNRFLLGLRIQYFRNMFSSGMADSGTDSSTLYTDTFTPEALTIICRYIYLTSNPQEPTSLLWFCGVPGQSDKENETLLRELKEYIHLDQLDTMESIHTLRTLKPCADYKVGSPPPASILTHLINVIKAAEYLGLDDLKSYITHTLTELAHNFTCRGPGCAVLLPKMLDKVYHEPLVPRLLLDNLVKTLGKAKAVQPLWKRSLIMMSPEAISYLITHIQTRILHDPAIKRTNEGGGTLAAFVLYVALAKLHRQVRGRSRDAGMWEKKLLDPLMKDFLTRLLAQDLCWCEYLVSREAAGLNVDITQALAQGIASRFMTRENCEKIWRVVSNRDLEFWDEQAMKSAVEWFKKEWLSLSVTPPEPDPRTSARPLPGGGGGGGLQKKLPRMKEAYEPNFFATWDRRDLGLLGKEMGVEVEDLLAQGHRAGLPPRTPRRSADAGMGEVGRRRAPIGSGGGAVIPRVGAGGGRTGQSGGATLLNAPRGG